MTKRTLLVFAVVFLQAAGAVYSYGKTDTAISFEYHNYDVNISSSDKEYFNGRLSISENGKILFSMDSSFTDYVEHKFIDLNGDGSNEMLLYLTEGASPYVFHYLYVFDQKKSAKPLFALQNGEVDTSAAGQPLLSVHLRMSPAILGLWYSWFVEYKGDMLSFIRPADGRNQQLKADLETIKQNLDELNQSNQICDDFAYNVFFEYVFITSKIAGNEVEAEKFFDENYKCENKVGSLKQFKKSASDTYSWIKEEENYNYTEY